MQPHIGSSLAADTLTVGSLFMGNDPAMPAGKLDLTDNALIVDYFRDDPTPHDYVRSLIVSAYANGAWTGNGITSSTAAATVRGDGVGYAEASALFASFPASFLGQPVDDSSLLARYTLYGDTNLDGEVNLTDFNKLAANFGMSGNWAEGDSSYDGQVNLSDFNRLAANFGKSIYDPDEEDGGGGGDGALFYNPTYTYDELYEMLMNWPHGG